MPQESIPFKEGKGLLGTKICEKTKNISMDSRKNNCCCCFHCNLTIISIVSLAE